ncbi:MAG TPA: chromophore lyase CpcT/CpeT [Candidatus Sulfomarinibacteraceae bacterium]|nr:chromophore lyase CpcT/CpeT [Candidatus Sulfomarinibacteraceae bacterium]
MHLAWFAAITAGAVLLAIAGAWAVDGGDAAEATAPTYRGRVELRSADGGWQEHRELELSALGGALELGALADGSAGRVLRLETASHPESSTPVLRLTLVELGDGGEETLASATADRGAARIGLAFDGLRAFFVRADPSSADLELLASWLTGSFNTAAQALADPETAAVDLHLAAIWEDRADGPWRYLEQAVPEFPESPYRQRVLRLAEPAPGLLEIEIWTLPEPAEAVGAWRLDEPLAGLSPGDLTPRPGCSILARRRGDVVEGSTIGTLCPSRLRGASWASSEIAVTADGLVSWDRGFADDGRQVWGPVDGGLVFDRVVASPEPPSVPVPVPVPVHDEPRDSGSDSDSDSGSGSDRGRDSDRAGRASAGDPPRQGSP